MRCRVGSYDRSPTPSSLPSASPPQLPNKRIWRMWRSGRACWKTRMMCRSPAGGAPQAPADRCGPSATRVTSCTGSSSSCLCASWDSVSRGIGCSLHNECQITQKLNSPLKLNCVYSSQVGMLTTRSCSTVQCSVDSLCHSAQSGFTLFQEATSVMTTRLHYRLKSSR